MGRVRVAVTGSHGLIGSALVSRLEDDGHTVVRLVRGDGGAGTVRWDPTSGVADPAGLEGLDAVVHLAGAGLGDHRWTDSYREEIRRSRVTGTRVLAEALARLDAPPGVLVSGSAVGWYGADRGPELLTEESGPGSGFLAELCRDWEAAAAPAAGAGVRVVQPRPGVVLSAAGGALARQLPLFRAGIGGRLGSGRHYVSWISRRDLVAAYCHLIDSELSGPVNVAAPDAVTNAELTAALGRVLHRPAVLPVPAFALRIVLGSGLADETALASQRVVPARLQASGFRFAHPDIESGLRAAVADRR